MDRAAVAWLRLARSRNVGPRTFAKLLARFGTPAAALVALHVAAVVFYKVWKREDLIRPMIDGWKTVRRE